MKRYTHVSRRAFRFFLACAGYATPPGRAVCAMRLAQAEEYAREQGWTFSWSPSLEDGDLGDHEYWCVDAHRTREYPSGRCNGHDIQACLLLDADGNPLAALNGIIDASPAYVRVIEAELAHEAMAERIK